MKSEAAFETALRIDPKHMKSLVNLSRVLVEQKRYDDAIVKLTAAEEVDPESATVPRLMARAHSAKGEFEQAVDAYRRAIALDGSDAWSMNNLGLLYLEHGFIEDAAAVSGQGGADEGERGGVPQQPGYGARAPGTLRGRGRRIQGRVDRGPRLQEGEAESCPRRSREERSGGAVRPCRGGAGYFDEDRTVASDDTRAN